MNRTIVLALTVAAAYACAGAAPERAPDTTASEKPAIPVAQEAAALGAAPAIRWPEDQTAYQLANLDSLGLTVPRCGDAALLGRDSVGFLRLGQPLSAIAARCPKAVPMWDWGDEGIPSPVLLLRLGDAVMRLAFEDTLSSSPMLSLATADSAARTISGVGPGSSLADLTRTYGTVRLADAECVLYATFASAAGVSFRLDSGGALDCEELVRVAEANDVARLPRSTRVSEVVVYQP